MTETTGEPATTTPTTAIAVRSQQASTLTAKVEYAKTLSDSGLLPGAYRKNPPNILWALEYGEMLGLSPMAAMTGVHVIEGKPTASAGLISALVRRAGHKLRVFGDTKKATCQIVRCDDPDYTFEVTWTLKRNSDDNPSAEEAGLLGKPVWKQYGASMLKSRAITQCARDACEEALYGLHYTAEELGAEVDGDGNVLGGTVQGSPGGLAPAPAQPEIVDAEIVQDGMPPDSLWHAHPEPEPVTDLAVLAPLLERAAAATEENYRDIWKDVDEATRSRALAKEDGKLAQGVITARMEAFRAGTVPAEPVSDVDAMSHLCDDLIPAATTPAEIGGLLFTLAGYEATGQFSAEHAGEIRSFILSRAAEIREDDERVAAESAAA